MTPTSAFIISLRPKTLTASLSPVLLGAALVKTEISIGLFLLTLLSAIFMQAGSNLANEYYDYKSGVDNENRLGPMRSLQTGALSVNFIKYSFITCFALAFLCGLLIVSQTSILIMFLGFVCLLSAWLYTGGPFPLSHYMLGEIFAFIFFGPVAVCGTTYILRGYFTFFDFVVSFVPGFISALLMSLNNLRDWQTDKEINKYTPASVFGYDWGNSISLILLFLTLVFPLIMVGFGKLHFAGLLCLVSFFLFFKSWLVLIKRGQGKELVSVLMNTGKYFFVHTLFLAIGVYLT